MGNEKQAVSLSAGLKAKILGFSRGTDISLVSLAVLSLIGTGGCFWLSLRQPLALIGAFVFLAGFCFVLYSWKIGGPTRSQLDAPHAYLTLDTESEKVGLSLPLDSKNIVLKGMLAQMRAIVQLRTSPPSPKGSVSGNPADTSGLKEYSSEERQAVQNEWAKEIPKHDELVVEQLDSAIGALESGEPQRGQGSEQVPGMPQAEDLKKKPVN